MTSKILILVALILLMSACGEENQDTQATATPEHGRIVLNEIPTVPGMILTTPTSLPIPVAIDDKRFPIQPDPAGQALYEAHCATCHGIDGDGQNPDNPYALNEDGLMVAPPHDSTGHTWHHPDQQNFLTVWRGRKAPGALEMPGFGEKITVDEVFQILAYIKTWWGDEELSSQIESTNSAASG